MGNALVSARGLAVSVLALVLIAGCSRREDDGKISAAPEHASPAQAAAAGSALPVTAAPGAAGSNPLAMPLKHDGPAPAASATVDDPCAVTQPTGALAMPLKHGGTPAQRNPLCMKLK